MRSSLIAAWWCSFGSLIAPSYAQEVPAPPPNPVPELLKLLTSDQRDVRLAAAEHLGAGIAAGNLLVAAPWNPIADLVRDASNSLLLRCEEDPDADVALMAGLALLELRPPTIVVRTWLAARLPVWRRAGAAESSIDAIGTALDSEAPLPDSILKPLAELTKSGPARAGSLAALMAFGSPARAVSANLVELLAEQPTSDHWRVALALAGLGDSTGLASALASPDGRLRLAAALACQRDTESGPPPNSAVVPWLNDDRGVVRIAALRAVPRLAEPPATAVRAVAEAAADPLLRSITDTALQALGPRATPAVPVLVGYLALQSSDLAQFAISRLGALGKEAEAAVEPLAQLASARDDTYTPSIEGGQALARIAPARGVSLLISAFDRDRADASHRWWNSSQALWAMGSAALPELPTFVGIVENGTVPERANAMRVLAAFGDKALPALPAVLRQLDSEDYWLWPTAMAIVRNIGPAAASTAVPKLEQRYGEVSEHLRMNCVLRLDRLGATAEPLLLRGSSDSDPIVRSEADTALVNLRELSPAGAAHIARLLAIPESKDLTTWLAKPTPWRHLVGPLTESTTLSPNLKALLPPLLDHPDFMVFAAVGTILVRDLCPAAANQFALEKLFAASVRDAVKKALADRSALTAWVRAMTEHSDGEVQAAAAALLPLLQKSEATGR